MYEAKFPKIFDHHNHLSFYLLLASSPSLEHTFAFKEARQFFYSLSDEKLNIVTGWHSDRYSLSNADLEDCPPLIVVNFCLHGFRFNEAARRILTEADIAFDPEDLAQSERIMPDILSFVGRSRPLSEAGKAWPKVREKWEAQGLYGMADMLSLYPDIDCGSFVLERWEHPQLRADWKPSEKTTGIKLFNDGAVGARTAAISAGFRGYGQPILTYSDEQLEERMRFCFKLLPKLAMHTIGDLAIGQALRVYESLKPQLEAEGIVPYLRLEHCQFITLEQAQAAKRLGIVLSMQPNFNGDSVDYYDRLGSSLGAVNNPLRMVIDKAGFVPGEDLLFGSDGMPSGLVNALQNALFPPYEGQRLSAEELLAGYKADAERGTVTVYIDEANKKVLSADQA
ncbi:amidohydrolase family protein [bacterium]|nr:amidohydrolase family protein [bacterium]